MNRVNACPVCEGTSFAPYAMSPSGPLHSTQARCTGCGLLVAQPQASIAEMDAYYAGPYYEREWPDPERAWRQNAPSYRAHELPLLRELWRDRPPPQGASVAEIGCGYGVLLRVLREEGYAVRGCELSAKAVQHGLSLGLDVVQGKWPGVPLPAASFDVVISMHVIEHVSDPLAFTRELTTLLKPGGVLVVGTEDAFTSQSAWERARDRLLGKVPAYRSSTEHTFVFGAAQLERLLGNAGLVGAKARAYDHRPPEESLHWRLYKTAFRTIDRFTGHGELLLAIARRPTS